jgi:hypothetical protein
MNLASDATQAARLELRFAEERLEEVTVGASRVPAPAQIESLAEMDQRSLAGAQQLVLAAEQEGDEQLLAEVDAFVERQSSGLVEVFARLPIEARPHAEDSLALLRQIRTDLLLPALEACDCLDIVPASHLESEFVPRATSDPLPPAPRTEPRRRRRASRPHPPRSQRSGGRRLPSETCSPATSPPATTPADSPPDCATPWRRPPRRSGHATRWTDHRDGRGHGGQDHRHGRGHGGQDHRDGRTRWTKTTDTVEDTVDETTDTVGDLLGSTTDSLGNILGR